jgi:hypothetical protein
MNIRSRVIMAAIVGLSVSWSAQAGNFRFPVGISYASGIQEANDKVFDYYQAAGFDVTRINIPIGLTLDPYYEWDSGIGVGVTVGPTAFLFIEEQYIGYYSSHNETRFSYAVPVGGFVRWAPLRHKPISPYVRVGVRYPIAGGDNYESGDPGVFGAVGVDFLRDKKVGISLEVGYDSSTMKVKYQTGGLTTYSDKVTFTGLTAGISVVF